MAAGRFHKPARRQRLQPVKAMRALLCAAAAVAAYSCAASLSFASGPSGRCAHQAARRTAASPRGSTLPRASRGGEAPGDAPLPLEKLEVGQKYKGTVHAVRDFGAFVDIGATSDGLVHISKIADEHVDNIHDYVQEGQEVEVWVSELGDDGRLSLSMVESRIGYRPRARRHWLEDVSPDEWLEGTVYGVQPYGAFVKVSHFGDMAEGLVHKSQLSDAYVENVEDEVQEGQKVKVRLLNYDAKEKKVAFSMKQPNMFEVGQKYTGTVHSVLDFGAFVDIGTTIGLVHISGIADERVDNIHDYVQEGQEVEVWISQVLDDGKLALTMVESRIGKGPRAQRHWLEDLSPDEWLEGTVSGVQPFGAFVKVSHYGDMAQGLVHKSELSDAYVENVEDEVQEGQRVKVRLLKYDAKEKKVYLSIKRPADFSKFEQFEGTSPDQWLTGRVTGTAPYGAFVAVAGEDGSEAAGLVHVTRLTDDLVDSFEDALQLGQEVKVRIVDLDAGAGRMRLSMKPAGSHEE